MKWFKHMTISHADERLADILSECGLEGYGFWWLLMEVVAAQCVEDKCSATYSLPHWSRLLYSHHNKVGKYLGKLGVTGIVTVESVEGKIRVTIPNLLKYRDEYSKKSRQTTESVRPKKEKEKQKENKDKIPSSSSDEADVIVTKKKRKLTGKRLETFLKFWEAFSYKAGRAEAADAWMDIEKLTMAEVDKIVTSAKSEALRRQTLVAEGKTPKMAQGWLAARRWEDEPVLCLIKSEPVGFKASDDLKRKLAQYE